MTTAEICNACGKYKKRWQRPPAPHECKGCFRKRTGKASRPDRKSKKVRKCR